MIAERVGASTAVRALRLPLDVVSAAREPRLVVAVGSADGTDWRWSSVASAALAGATSASLAFRPLEAGASRTISVVVLAGDGRRIEPMLRRLVPVLDARPPIDLDVEPHVAGLPAALGDRVEIRVSAPGRPIEHHIDAFWADHLGVYLRGWVRSGDVPVTRVTVGAGAEPASARTLEVRRDIAGAPAYGFDVYAPARLGSPVTLIAQTRDGAGAVELTFPAGETPPDADVPLAERDDRMWRRFVDHIPDPARILEIGARRVSPMALDRREELTRIGRYVGVDIIGSPAVDVVADAHGLSDVFREGSFDVVFSESVLEHVTAPWVVAAEINRILRAGGVTYHHVPMTFPVHELPNDFWRMTDAGLRQLFGPATGFEVIETAMDSEVRVVPGVAWRIPPFADVGVHPSWGVAHVLARKVRDLPADAVSWPVAGLESERLARRYPAHDVPV